jgi:hypothetical protein
VPGGDIGTGLALRDRHINRVTLRKSAITWAQLFAPDIVGLDNLLPANDLILDLASK